MYAGDGCGRQAEAYMILSFTRSPGTFRKSPRLLDKSAASFHQKDPKKKLERRKRREHSSKAQSRLNEIAKNDEPAKSRRVASDVSARVYGAALIQWKISSTDPITYGSVSLLLTGVAFLASLVPAIRAARSDPLATLRHE